MYSTRTNFLNNRVFNSSHAEDEVSDANLIAEYLLWKQI